MDEIEAALQDYSFEEILEFNDLTLEEVLKYLVEHMGIALSERRSD